MALFARRPTEQEARAIRAILRQSSVADVPHSVLFKRAHAVALSLQREKVPQIATELDVHYTTIIRWLTCYNRFGWTALVTMPSSIQSSDTQSALDVVSNVSDSDIVP